MSTSYELNRTQFAIRYGILCIAVWTTAYLAAPYAKTKPILYVFVPLLMLALFVLTTRYLLIPRNRNIGWSPWRLLWLLVPVAGVVFLALLFALPAKKNA